MWIRSWLTKEEVDNGRSTRQNGQEDATGNRPFRLPKMQETLQGCVKQEKDLGGQRPNMSKKQAKTNKCPICEETATVSGMFKRFACGNNLKGIVGKAGIRAEGTEV